MDTSTPVDVSNSPRGGTAISFGTPETITFVDGVASLTPSTTSNGVMRLYKAEPATITVTDGSISNTGLHVTVGAGTAKQLAFVQQPSGGSAGVAVSPAVTVQVEDQFGNAVAGSGLTVSIAVASGPGSFAGGSTVSVSTDGSGLASFSNLVLDSLGSFVLKASSAGLGDSPNSSSFLVGVGPADKLAFVQQPSGGSAGVAVSPAVTVQVEDQFGNAVAGSGLTVSVAVASGPGLFAGGSTASVSTDGSGLASFSNLVLDSVGSFVLKASSAGLGDSPNSSSFLVGVGPADKLAFVQQPSGGSAGVAVSPAVTVQVEDQFGNAVAGSGLTVSVAVASGPGLFAGGSTASVSTDGSGLASFSNLVLDSVGSFVLKASSAGLGDSPNSSSFAVGKAPTATAVVSTTGTPSVTGQTVTYTATVEATSPGAGTPTGSIEFFDGGNPIGVCGSSSGEPLSGLSATCNMTGAATGSQAVSAQYLGDGFYEASAVSAPITQVVDKAATLATVVSTTGTPSVVGQQVTYTATVSVLPQGGGTPTGAVEFLDGGTPIAACKGGSGEPLGGLGAACQVTYNATSTGETITAQYLGDTNYNASAVSSPIAQVVGRASTTTSSALSATSVGYGNEQTIIYTSTVTPELPGIPTGTVTLAAGSTTLCTSVLPATTCSSPAAVLAASGTAYAVTATYGGDTNFTDSSSAPATLTVDSDTTTAAVSESPTTVSVGSESASVVTVTVTTGNGEPLPTTDTVTVNVGSASCVASVAPAANGGTGTCTIGNGDLPASGTPYTVSATYPGDADLSPAAPASASPGLTVTGPTTNVIDLYSEVQAYNASHMTSNGSNTATDFSFFSAGHDNEGGSIAWTAAKLSNQAMSYTASSSSTGSWSGGGAGPFGPFTTSPFDGLTVAPGPTNTASQQGTAAVAMLTIPPAPTGSYQSGATIQVDAAWVAGASSSVYVYLLESNGAVVSGGTNPMQVLSGSPTNTTFSIATPAAGTVYYLAVAPAGETATTVTLDVTASLPYH